MDKARTTCSLAVLPKARPAESKRCLARYVALDPYRVNGKAEQWQVHRHYVGEEIGSSPPGEHAQGESHSAERAPHRVVVRISADGGRFESRACGQRQ